MFKQNMYPTRQGELYKVNLAHNHSDGPFLKKDIMHNNKKSLALLTSQQVLQTISHFNNSMTMLQTKTRQISTLYPQNVDNISKTYQKCQSQLSILFNQSSKLFKQQQVLKNSLQQIFEQQKQNQQQLYYQCMPLLKNLFKTIKDSRNKQKDQYHLMERMITQIQGTKKVLVEGMIQCQRRIIKLQQAIGWQTTDKQQNN